MIEILIGVVIILLILLNIRFRNKLEEARDMVISLLGQIEENKKQVVDLNKQKFHLMEENIKLKEKLK